MGNMKNILFFLLILILVVPNIGICKKMSEEDKQERSVIGNTYKTKLLSDYTSDFSERNSDRTGPLFIAEDIDVDFMILDLVEDVMNGRVIGNRYKVILNFPDGKKILAYIDKDRFEIIESSQLNGTFLKSKMSDEDRQKLISDNERKRIAEEQKEKERKRIVEEQEEKKIAKVKEMERQKREKFIKQKIAEIKKKHSDWNDETIRHIARGSVHIGMTKDQAILAWGKPETVNKTITAILIREQWCYYDRSYLYFENGILTTIQN